MEEITSRKIDTTLEGTEMGKGSHVNLDPEQIVLSHEKEVQLARILAPAYLRIMTKESTRHVQENQEGA